jgi:hypothetical protein
MFQALVAFLTVMSGYVFVSTWHHTRYLLLRQPSQRIYFRSAFWGIWLFVLALAVSLGLRNTFNSVLEQVFVLIPGGGLLSPGGNGEFERLLLLSLVICLLLGLFGGYVLNWLELIRRWPRDWKSSLLTTLEGNQPLISALYSLTSRRPLERAIEYLNADLERLMLNALREEKPICLTLTDRKVYIGYLCGAIDPSDGNDMIRILPYMSGFRSPESLELVITDYYDQLYDKQVSGACHRKDRADGVADTGTRISGSPVAGQSDFEVALPIRDIRSCRLFDTGLYLNYQRERYTQGVGFVCAES